MEKLLRILTTDKCNLSCSFCNQKEQMSSYPKPIKNLDDILEDHLSTNHYDGFCISGGEPFVDLKSLEKILGVLIPQDKTITINTNGTYLNSTILENLVQYDNVRLQISIDGLTGEFRGLNTLISKYGIHLINLIKEFPRKNINFVVPRKRLNQFELATEILSLSLIFKCKVQLLIDENEYKDYGIDDAFNLQNLLIRLNLINAAYSVNSFFNSECNGDCNLDLYWDGRFVKECSIVGSGCTQMRNAMKPGLYDLLRKIVTVTNEDYNLGNVENYFYSLETNYKNKDDTMFKPTFKHSIDGNRRFLNNSSISIKEVV